MRAIPSSEICDGIHEIVATVVSAAWTAAQAELVLAQECHAAHARIVPTTIHLLPFEILREIFLLSIGPSPSISFPLLNGPSPWTLTWVCRRWQTIALSSPVLWTSFTLLLDRVPPVSYYRRHGRAVRTAMERAHPLPLSFVLSSLESYLPSSTPLQGRRQLWDNIMLAVNRPPPLPSGSHFESDPFNPPPAYTEVPPIDPLLPCPRMTLLYPDGRGIGFERNVIKQLLSTLSGTTLSELTLHSLTPSPNNIVTAISVIASNYYFLPLLTILRIRIVHEEKPCMGPAFCIFQRTMVQMGAKFYELRTRSAERKVEVIEFEVEYRNGMQPRCVKRLKEELEGLVPTGLKIEVEALKLES